MMDICLKVKRWRDRWPVYDLRAVRISFVPSFDRIGGILVFGGSCGLGYMGSVGRSRKLGAFGGSKNDVTSELIYDLIDQGDIQYLLSQASIPFADVADAVKRLPPPFNNDCMVLENLENFRSDSDFWKGGAA